MTSSFPRRSDVRTHASVLCACLAVIMAVNFGRPGLLDWSGQLKGPDFLQFYVAGTIALRGDPGALYDPAAFAKLGAKLVPESSGVYYLPVYGPQMSLLFAPFALLPYGWALLAWVLITTAIYGICCWAVWSTCLHLRNEGPTIVIIAAAFPALFNLITHGQNSAIALACLTGAFLALRQNRRCLAGLAIGMLVYKPQLAIVMACVFVVSLQWRIVVGAISGAALQLGAAWIYYGTSTMGAYYQWIRGIGNINHLLEPKPYQMHSLLSFWKLLVPNLQMAVGLYILCACVLLVASCRIWRTAAPLSLRYSFLLLATVLISPHLFVYDLVILAPALLMAGDWALGHPDDARSKPVQRLMYYSYALPLAGAATQFTHIQASVIAMSALSWVLASIAFRYQETPLATSQVNRCEPV
jgi:Glycosyltransferase family 87